MASHSVEPETASPSGVAQDRVSSREIYDVVGYRVAVGASSVEGDVSVRSILRGFGPQGPAADTSLPRYDLVASSLDWQVRIDDSVVHTGDDLLSALGALESRLINTALERRDDLFHLHAAALCLPTERAGIVLVGDSGRGKSTLALALMLRGFVPFSDDVALMDPPTLDLQPLRRAFHVDDESWRLVEPLGHGPLVRRDAPVGYFSPPQWAERPVPVRWVLFPEYRPEQAPQLISMAPAEAATGILAQSLTLGRATRIALKTATRLTERAKCYRFLVGDLVLSVAAVQQLVACQP